MASTPALAIADGTVKGSIGGIKAQLTEPPFSAPRPPPPLSLPAQVPSMNFNRDQTLASLERPATALAEKKGQLWINHDKPRSATLRYAPAYYE